MRPAHQLVELAREFGDSSTRHPIVDVSWSLTGTAAWTSAFAR